jgi:hypothetical protein
MDKKCVKKAKYFAISNLVIQKFDLFMQQFVMFVV